MGHHPFFYKTIIYALNISVWFIVAHPNADFTPQEKAFIYILYSCGVRPAEMYALTRSDVDLKKKELTINKTLIFSKDESALPKTDAGIRTLLLTDSVVKAIKELYAVNSSMILFCDENGMYKTRSAYYWMWNQAKKIIGKQKLKEAQSPLTQYTFRHNFCTELYYAGVSMKEAQRLMEHSDYSMIMKVYSHLDASKENTREKLQKLSNFDCHFD